MRVSELFDYANKNDFTDLQALIMFLVFEKKVLNMDDDTSELDLYFLEKHSSRMNKELHSYKKKMNMGYKPDVYMVKTDKGIVYVYAHSEVEAKTVVNKRLMKVSEVKVCYMDDLIFQSTHPNRMRLRLRKRCKINKNPFIHLIFRGKLFKINNLTSILFNFW